ncbi:MAG: 50S ribosome-binding GTPase [Bacilli bacterium]|nr:50S ribosome-binding GTPase [Bacilli bacterium]
MIRCSGCGAILQNLDENKEGYTDDLNKPLCKRCFKITHYNEYITVDKDGDEFTQKLEFISSTNDLVILTVDFINMIDFDKINIKNPILLVFTKRDILPKNMYEDRILSKIKTNLNIVDKMFISSMNNYNLDELLLKVKKYKKSDDVYLIGLTNSGKSTLLNKLIKNYSDTQNYITVSNLPSTTLDFIKRKIDGITFIDTPGLLDDVLSEEYLKKVTPNKMINPIVYQIKTDQIITVEDFLRIDVPKDNILIFYMSNSLKINRFYKEKDNLKNLKKSIIKINAEEDLVIKGIGFIKFKKDSRVIIYSNFNYFIRKSII